MSMGSLLLWLASFVVEAPQLANLIAIMRPRYVFPSSPFPRLGRLVPEFIAHREPVLSHFNSMQIYS